MCVSRSSVNIASLKKHNLCLPCSWSHLVQDLLHIPSVCRPCVQQKAVLLHPQSFLQKTFLNASGVYFLDMSREDRGVECFRQSLSGKLVKGGVDGCCFPFLVALSLLFEMRLFCVGLKHTKKLVNLPSLLCRWNKKQANLKCHHNSLASFLVNRESWILFLCSLATTKRDKEEWTVGLLNCPLEKCFLN